MYNIDRPLHMNNLRHRDGRPARCMRRRALALTPQRASVEYNPLRRSDSGWAEKDVIRETVGEARPFSERSRAGKVGLVFRSLAEASPLLLLPGLDEGNLVQYKCVNKTHWKKMWCIV